MILVNVQRNKNGEIFSIVISGHAYADEPGRDIICASVSVLSQTVILGLYEIVKMNIHYEIRDGYLKMELPQRLTSKERDQANLLLDTMLTGIRNIMQSYPGYISIRDKEV